MKDPAGIIFFSFLALIYIIIRFTLKNTDTIKGDLRPGRQTQKIVNPNTSVKNQTQVSTATTGAKSKKNLDKEIALEWLSSIKSTKRLIDNFYDRNDELEFSKSLKRAGWDEIDDGVYAFMGGSQFSSDFAFTFAASPDENLFVASLMHRNQGECPIKLLCDNDEITLTGPVIAAPKIFQGIIREVESSGVHFRGAI